MDICLKRRNMETDVTPMTPASSIVSALRISDDSGYHTSFTPSSIELSEVSNENLDPKLFYSRSLTDRDALFHIFSPKRRRLKSSGADGNYENTPDSPPSRRGRKRRAEFEVKVDNSAPTPTSYITGGIQNLHLSKANELLNSVNYSQSVQINWSESDCSDVLYPTTPVKKYKINKYSPTYYIKSSPKRSNSTVCPPKKSLKKLNFDPQINETLNECQKDVKEKYTKKTLKSMKYKPDDIMEMLRNANPVINKIFSYLDNQDIYNFSLVSPVWYSVCINNSEANYRRNEYIDYVNSTKENYKNRDKCKEGEVDRSIEKREQPAKALKDSNNSLNTQTHSKRSPPGTPRTIKFKKFTKSASLDSRLQLSCVRCCQPAKVTKESSGEEWAECSSGSCAFQFCKKCSCERHPQKTCFQYDLEAPSPSKRKKSNYTIGTMKSKRNLRRLLA